jgi:hypothetical protein
MRRKAGLLPTWPQSANNIDPCIARIAVARLQCVHQPPTRKLRTEMSVLPTNRPEQLRDMTRQVADAVDPELE